MAINPTSTAEELSSSASRLADEAQAGADRLASATRGTVDRAASTARDTMDRISDGAPDFADELSGRGDRLLAEARDYVAAHPISTLVMAAAAGYFIGRLMR